MPKRKGPVQETKATEKAEISKTGKTAKESPAPLQSAKAEPARQNPGAPKRPHPKRNLN